jgi:hypothetical protein
VQRRRTLHEVRTSIFCCVVRRRFLGIIASCGDETPHRMIITIIENYDNDRLIHRHRQSVYPTARPRDTKKRILFRYPLGGFLLLKNTMLFYKLKKIVYRKIASKEGNIFQRSDYYYIDKLKIILHNIFL